MGTFFEASMLRVLQCYHGHDVIGFVDLARKLGFGTDLTGYYLRRLERKGLVEKIERGSYRITGFGKSVLAHNAQLNDISRPRVSVLLIAKLGENAIIRKRKIQPFIGQHEWPTRHLPSDESIQEAAATLASRIIEQPVVPVFRGFFRQTDLLSNGALFDDKLFAVHVVNLPPDVSIIEKAKAGSNIAVPIAEIHTISNKSSSLMGIWDFAQGRDVYVEKSYCLSTDDLYNVHVPTGE